LALLLATSAHAQTYSIDWFTIDGGGGTSTGGVYQVSGTIGQPDAGPAMSGGNFSLTSGFWSLLSVVQAPGAPTLRITLTSTNAALVSWPSPSTGFTLQQNTNSLASVNWSNVSATIQDNGTIKYIYHCESPERQSVLPVAQAVTRRGVIAGSEQSFYTTKRRPSTVHHFEQVAYWFQ